MKHIALILLAILIILLVAIMALAPIVAQAAGECPTETPWPTSANPKKDIP